jgi:hypothetical protein
LRSAATSYRYIYYLYVDIIFFSNVTHLFISPALYWGIVQSMVDAQSTADSFQTALFGTMAFGAANAAPMVVADKDPTYDPAEEEPAGFERTVRRRTEW